MPIYTDKRNNCWRYSFNQVVNGQRVRVTKLLPKNWTRSEAQAYDQVESARLFGAATGTVKQRPLIGDAVVLYCTYQCEKLKNGKGVRAELAHIHGYYEGRYIDELADVAREFTEQATKSVKDPADPKGERRIDVPLSPASKKNKLSYLRAAVRYAQKHHGFGDRDARHEVAMPVVRNTRHEYASRAEMLRIARACPNRHCRALIRLAFYTGMRLGELMAIGREGTKSRVIENGFFLHDTKNGQDRIAAMHPRLRVVCRYLPIPFEKRWMQRLYERASDAAGLSHFHFHDLRHSTASSLINNGVDLYTVGAVLGHKDPRSTQRYSHLATATLQAAVRKIR